MLWLCLHLPQLGDLPALERLAAWAYQWSSEVSYRHQPPAATLWLEVGASGALWGDPKQLLTRLDHELHSMQYPAQLALAPTPEGAALLARAQGAEDFKRCSFSLGELRQCIAALPLQSLALPEEALEALSRAGLRHIGEVLALPPAAIARRFGPEASLHLRQLCGEAPDLRPAWQLPTIYRTHHEFGFELFQSDALLFPLQRLYWAFQGYLRARDQAVQRFTVKLKHPRGAPTIMVIGLSRPSRDAAQFLRLTREHLSSLQLPAPVTALNIEALEFCTPDVAQGDFFGTEAQRLRDLQQLLDRLIARLGVRNVCQLQSLEDHRPERAWRFIDPLALPDHRSLPAGAARPCWLLERPHRIEAPEGVGRGERIESGWWDGTDVARDYYCVRTTQGEYRWVFRNLRDGLWYLQGLWS